MGLLLLDTTPRRFLDDETILLGLCRQISHSIETCRLVEEKISLERALARQEHLATLGKVTVTIAHEVKNPLSSVKTLAQLMREDTEVNSRYARDLNYIVGEVDRLNLTVQQLLTFSRPAPQQREDVDVSRMVWEIGEMLGRAPAGARPDRAPRGAWPCLPRRRPGIDPANRSESRFECVAGESARQHGDARGLLDGGPDPHCGAGRRPRRAGGPARENLRAILHHQTARYRPWPGDCA